MNIHVREHALDILRANPHIPCRLASLQIAECEQCEEAQGVGKTPFFKKSEFTELRELIKAGLGIKPKS